MKSIAVIVTFNRKELLKENLKMLCIQTQKIDEILIIDNHSTDGTQDEINSEFNGRIKIIYKYMDKNYGGAGGFYYGVKFAYELKADFIWLMDDDGKPFNSETYKNIYIEASKLYKKNKLLFLNSLVTYDGLNLSFGLYSNIKLENQWQMIKKEKKDNILYNKVNPFNGTLITKELVDKIGFPRKEFFISRDETDYAYRSENAGAIIATIINSIYYHPRSKLKFKKLLFIKTQIYMDMDKEYYFIRNLTYSYKNTDKLKIYKFIIVRILTIILFENSKLTRIKQVYRAKKDAFEGKMGKK